MKKKKKQKKTQSKFEIREILNKMKNNKKIIKIIKL